MKKLRKGVDEAGNQKQVFKSMEEWARSVGASVFVAGTFAKTADGIGISLRALSSSDSPRSLAEATGLVPVSDEITTLVPRTHSLSEGWNPTVWRWRHGHSPMRLLPGSQVLG